MNDEKRLSIYLQCLEELTHFVNDEFSLDYKSYGGEEGEETRLFYQQIYHDFFYRCVKCGLLDFTFSLSDLSAHMIENGENHIIYTVEDFFKVASEVVNPQDYNLYVWAGEELYGTELLVEIVNKCQIAVYIDHFDERDSKWIVFKQLIEDLFAKNDMKMNLENFIFPLFKKDEKGVEHVINLKLLD